jgi:hypothetical protein
MSQRVPTPCERAVAWAINVRVAQGLARGLGMPPSSGGLAAIVAMLAADNRRPEEQGLFRIPIQLLTLPGSVALAVLEESDQQVEAPNEKPKDNPRHCGA